MDELYAIFYTDHAIKTKERDWLNYKMPENISQDGRLDNQFGTYMREHLYREMEKKSRH